MIKKIVLKLIDLIIKVKYFAKLILFFCSNFFTIKQILYYKTSF